MNFSYSWGPIWNSYVNFGALPHCNDSTILANRLLDRGYEQKTDLREFLLLLGSHLELICQFRTTPPLQRQRYSLEPTARSRLRKQNTVFMNFGDFWGRSGNAARARFSARRCLNEGIEIMKILVSFLHSWGRISSSYVNFAPLRYCSHSTILCKALLERSHRNNEDSGQFSQLLGSHFDFICQFRTTLLLQRQHYSLQGAAGTEP